MGMVFQTKGKKQVDVHFVNTPAPCVVEEKFGGYFHDDDDSALAEALQDQELVYQSFQRNAQNERTKASSSADFRPNHVNGQQTRGGNSSKTESFESQLAMDEALAKELQEMENQLAGTSLSDITVTEAGTTPTQHSSTTNHERNSASTSAQVSGQDDIDPDNMTYEELQQLGETVGTESRGLSDELISFLPSSTYKTGLFSKKEKQEQCVICYTAYKNRDKLIMLPCQHQYHKSCITTWLKINKTCPVCNEEVFGSK